MESPFHGPVPELIETLRWDGARLIRLERHLARAMRSARALGIPADRQALRAALAAIAGPAPRRVRLAVDAKGVPTVTQAPLRRTRRPWRVALSPERIDSADPWLRHKTTRRALYDAARADMPDDIDEMLFANERGELCEGAITNLFFDIGDGLRTPPLDAGLLPGILRETLLDQGRCHVARLWLDALPQARLWVGNSLRGLIPAVLSTRPD